MLRADAPSFMPPQHFIEESKFGHSVLDDNCSTAAPSPALTATSLLGSPAASPWHEFYIPGAELQWFLDSDQLQLPDADDLQLPDVEEACKAEFSLQGLDELAGSVAGLLANMGVQAQVVSNTGESEDPVVLQAPPGLELLKEDEEVLVVGPPPPGLEIPAAISVLPPGCITAMLRNIPNKYTQSMLVEQLHIEYKGDIDFLYLPVDFKNKCNVGYCFLNFRTPESCARFAAEFHLADSRVKLPGFNSKKVCEVSPARVQGCESNMRRLRSSPVISQLLEKPEWLPQLFDEQGAAKAFQVPEELKGRGSRRS